jgi:hypothetical protein
MIPVDRACADLRVTACPTAGSAGARSDVLMARLRPGGIFELLSPEAWARVLGYPPEELSGKYLRELMPVEPHAAGEVVAGLLDTRADAPLDVLLRCKDERRKYFRFHRRFDERAQTIFLVADELE